MRPFRSVCAPEAVSVKILVQPALEGVVLEPLPYPNPDRLVLVALYTRTLKSATNLSYPDFLDWLRSSRSFEQIAAFRQQGFDLTCPGEPEHVGPRCASHSVQEIAVRGTGRR